jgi:ribosomal protein S18 acetylase RimI-like enzyme
MDCATARRENPPVTEILPARGAGDLKALRELFREYAQGVAEPCCFAGFERELTGLPGEYAPPRGALLLARDGRSAAGCVALRREDDHSGEMKRLYVRAPWRGRGLGRALALAAIAAARGAGYRRLLLDTLPKMTEAIALYRSLGFQPTGPYSATPTPGALCFALSLAQPGHRGGTN